MIGAGPRLGLGLGHRLVESVDALALGLDEVRLRPSSIQKVSSTHSLHYAQGIPDWSDHYYVSPLPLAITENGTFEETQIQEGPCQKLRIVCRHCIVDLPG